MTGEINWSNSSPPTHRNVERGQSVDSALHQSKRTPRRNVPSSHPDADFSLNIFFQHNTNQHNLTLPSLSPRTPSPGSQVCILKIIYQLLLTGL